MSLVRAATTLARPAMAPARAFHATARRMGGHDHK